MAGKPTIDRKECPDGKAVEDQARRAFEALLTYCRTEDGKFHRFEQRLFTRLFALGRLLVLVYLTHRNLRLPVRYNERNYRRGEPYATRTLQTVFGEVTYGRLYLRRRKGGSGYHPLDVALGLTRDGFSPTAISLLARLTTRMSYQSVQVICRAAWGWAPSTETLHAIVMGVGTLCQRLRRCGTMVEEEAKQEEGRHDIGHRGGRQVPTDGNGGGVGQTAVFPKELSLLLSAASRQAQAATAGP